MNGRETEVKFFVHNVKRIEMRLRELKAQLIQPRVHEINLRFDDASGSLRKNLIVLRLRKDMEAKFTFKGPSELIEGGVMSRKEIEFSVSDFESAKQFLKELGFTPIVFYEKFRTTYELEGVHIMLDELPYGQFIEIEGEDVGTLRKVTQLLDLNWDAMVKAGYHALFERITGKYQLDPSQLSFEALKSVQVDSKDLEITYSDNT